MAYASSDDVFARAGRLRGAFGNSDAPTTDEIDAFCDEVSALVDAKLARYEIDVPVSNVTARDALRGVVADGALLMALPAAYPSEQGAAAAKVLLDRTQARYEASMKAIDDGTAAVVVMLREQHGGVAEAGNFWTENPQYDLTRYSELVSVSPSIRPGVSKTDRF